MLKYLENLTIKKEIILISVLFFVGTLLRTVHIAQNPPSMNRDELAIGYNAYSLVKTHREEHGIGPWPLNFPSFGEYKLPGTIYLTALSVNFFGLSPLSVRLPSALVACLAIPALYLFTRELFKRKDISIVSTILFTFSYWHIAAARSVYEPVVALPMTLFGLYLLLLGRRKIVALPVGIILIVVSFFFYNAPLIIYPPIIFTMLVIFFSDYKKIGIKKLGALGAFFFLSLAFVFFILSGVNSGRSQTTIFGNSVIIDEVNTYQTSLKNTQVPPLMQKLLINKATVYTTHVIKGYLSSFNPSFVFLTGDNNPWHNLQNIGLGNLSIVLLPFFIIGVFSLVTRNEKDSKTYYFLLSYLLISPLANAITVDAPITNRLSDFHTAVIMISAIGFIHLIKSIKNTRLSLIATTFACTLYILLFLRFIILYFTLYPVTVSNFWYKEAPIMISQIEEIKEVGDRIYVPPTLNLGYIYVLFYTKFDPVLFQKETTWTKDGFVTPQNAGNYVFSKGPIVENLDIGTLQTLFSGKTKRIITISSEYQENSLMPILFTLNNDQGKLAWEVRTFSISDAVKLVEKLPNSKEKTEMLTFLTSL